MVGPLLRRKKDLELERSYRAPIGAVWDAWTRADQLREWWCPEHTSVTDCEVDLRVGGRIYVVTQAGPKMGKYEGTRWPMEGTFTRIDVPGRLVYEARSWTEGEQEGSTIHHVNDLTLAEAGGKTNLRLRVAITQIGPKAKMAAFGMKWGYKAQLDNLAGTVERDKPVERTLTTDSPSRRRAALDLR